MIFNRFYILPQDALQAFDDRLMVPFFKPGLGKAVRYGNYNFSAVKRIDVGVFEPSREVGFSE